MQLSDLHNLTEILQRERSRAGMTVRQLADDAGLTASTVFRLETGAIGSPKPDHLQRIARALGIDVEELYAAAGYSVPIQLPELTTYLRTKYGLSEDATSRIEGYVQAIRDDTNQRPPKEGQHEHSREDTP